MKLTPELLRQNAAAMLAHADGLPVETRESSSPWRVTIDPIWDFENNQYRPKKEPVERQWSKPEDVPEPVCWIRLQTNPTAEMMVTAVCAMGVHAGGVLLEWAKLEDFEFATHRSGWKPCVVEE